MKASEHDKEIQQAQAWLKEADGNASIRKYILENLLVNLQIEAKEGQNIREDEKSGPMLARQARKQLKETAELIMELTAGEK